MSRPRCENRGVNEERTWSIGVGGDEPIEVDPHYVPDHDINGVWQMLSRLRTMLTKIVGSGTTPEISDGGYGPFDEGGSL